MEKKSITMALGLERILGDVTPNLFATLEQKAENVLLGLLQGAMKRPSVQKAAREILGIERDYVLFSFGACHVKESGEYTLLPLDELTKEISEGLEKKLGRVRRDTFLNDESLFTVNENVRRKDIYLIFNPDPQKDLDGEIFRLLMLTKTLKSAHAGNITIIAPNMAYSRQDQSYGKRQLVTSRFLAEMFEAASIDHIITIGLHSPQIEGYHKSIDHLKTRHIFADYLLRGKKDHFAEIVNKDPASIENVVDFFREKVALISPDAGGLRAINELNYVMDKDRYIDIGFIQKVRNGMNQSETGKVVGDVNGKIVVLYDDILDTGGTLMAAARSLKDAGAVYVMALIDHALGNSKPGVDDFATKLGNSQIDELVVTNTVGGFMQKISHVKSAIDKTTLVSIAPYIQQAINRDQKGYSLREMERHVPANTLYIIGKNAT